MTASIPTVLITNDDGPPNDHDSPFILGFVKALQTCLGWSAIRVVIPSSQKSWIGKAYFIRDRIAVSEARFPDVSQDPWILLDGTPATCSNIALHNLYSGQIDLVVSGPNFGRNTSSAFALSSGTVGAAMSASMSGVPAIALSYGIFDKPIPEGCVQKAHEIACTVINKLWQDVLQKDAALADVYNINIPLTTNILSQSSAAPKVAWTSMGKNKYGRLFAPVEDSAPDSTAQKQAEEAGPAAVPVHSPSSEQKHKAASSSSGTTSTGRSYRFKPEIGLLVNPDPKSIEAGTDIHALHSGWCSVTPIRATFALGDVSTRIETEEGAGKGLWKL